MFDWIKHVPPGAELVILLASLIAAVIAIYKAVLKPVWKFSTRVNHGMDALLGYQAIVDPATGRQLQGETPSMASRVFKLEESQAQVALAITKLADLQEAITERDKKYDDWIAKHETEANERELRLHEWEQWRAEQTSMWEMIRHNMPLHAVDNP